MRWSEYVGQMRVDDYIVARWDGLPIEILVSKVGIETATGGDAAEYHLKLGVKCVLSIRRTKWKLSQVKICYVKVFRGSSRHRNFIKYAFESSDVRDKKATK